MRRKFEVTFTIELDELKGDFIWFDETIPADRLTNKVVAGHVLDLEWSGGCAHPAFALHANRNIKVSKVKVRRAK